MERVQRPERVGDNILTFPYYKLQYQGSSWKNKCIDLVAIILDKYTL